MAGLWDDALAPYLAGGSPMPQLPDLQMLARNAAAANPAAMAANQAAAANWQPPPSTASGGMWLPPGNFGGVVGGNLPGPAPADSMFGGALPVGPPRPMGSDAPGSSATPPQSLLKLQEQMGRGEDMDPASLSLPSWLPPEVQRYMRAAPDYGEGEIMAPGQFYNPQQDPRDAMRPGDASSGLSRAWWYKKEFDAAGWPRDEGNTGLQYGWNPYAGGRPGDEGARGYPQMRPDTSSPLMEMIRRVLAGGRQST